MNKSVMKCCICNNENIGQFITINNKKYHLCCIEQLEQENEKLKERIEYLERSNNRREDTIFEQRQEISDLEDNWNKLKKYIKTEIPEDVFIDTEWFVSILDKMQELEQGRDSND